MSCKCAKRTDEYHGWECTITEGPCEFYIPDSKACAEKFGEGPDSRDDANNQKEIACKKCDYHTEDGECVMECAWCKYYEVDEEMEPCDSCLRTNLCNFIANDEETIKMAEERLKDDDGTRYTTEDILKMRENKDRHEQAIEYFDGYGSPYDDMVIKALKKQVPIKKLLKGLDTYCCPNCTEDMEYDEMYCRHCGQHTWVE